MATSTPRPHQLICLLTALICAVPSLKASAEPFNFQNEVIKGVTDANGGAGGQNQNDDSDDDDGPIIKLPTLPAKPGTGGVKPTPTPRPSGQDMKPLDKSAFPGESCVLVDNRPHKELVDAIQALAKVVVITPQCQDNQDVAKMNSTAQGLITAAQNLQNQWANAATMANDPKALGQFQSDVAVLVQGIESISNSIANNSLVNGACGRQMTSTADVLIAMSDLVTTAAPYALMGASMGPHAAITIPFVLGLTGAGSVAKIIKTMHDQNTLDTNKYENRMAVLQNVCEFSKISQRVRFLKLAQSGQLDKVTQELALMKTSTDQILRLQFSDHAFAMNAIRDNELKSLGRIYSTLRKDQREYKDAMDLMELNNPQADQVFACYNMREVIASDAADTWTNRALSNFKTLIAKQTKMTSRQKGLLSIEAQLRKKLVTNKDESAEALASCARDTKAYMKSMESILVSTQRTVSELYASMDRQLGRDTEFVAFLNKQTNLQEDQQTMNKVANVLKQLNDDNSVIDKVEMDYQMAELRRALFGKRPGGLFNAIGDVFYSANGEPPALAWLNFVDTQWNRNTTAFDTEMNGLIIDSFKLTASGKKYMYPLQTWGSGSELNPRVKQLNTSHMKEPTRSQYLNDVNTALLLLNLTPAIAPKDSANQKAVCHRLENAWFAWAAALDQLRAQAFFCENIRDFFDSSTEPDLIQRCNGQVDLAGKVVTASDIQKAGELMVRKGYKDQATIVSQRMKDLVCPTPDISVMK